MRLLFWLAAALLITACHHATDGAAEEMMPDCAPLSLGAKPAVLAGKPAVVLVYDSSRFRLERTEGATVAKELDQDAVGLLVNHDPVVLHFTDMRCHKKLRAHMSATDLSDVRVEVEE